MRRENKWIRKGIIPLILFGLWFVLTSWYILIFDQSILVISYNQPTSNFTRITHSRLLKGEKLSGEFVAKDNNLGIVAMRFKTFTRIPYKDEDLLEFRLKEKGQSGWYYNSIYRSGLTFDVPFLPFGFPKIADSKGKTYIFELISLKGNAENGVALSSRQPFLETKYQANKAALLARPYKLISFGLTKFFNAFHTIDILYSSFVFALPLLFYLFWLSYFKKRLVDPLFKAFYVDLHKRSERLLGIRYVYAVETFLIEYYLLSILLLVVSIDILVLQILNDLLYIVIIALWLFLVKMYKLSCIYSFAAGLVFLTLAPLALQLNNEGTAEKAGAWACMFLIAGLIQALIELRN